MRINLSTYNGPCIYSIWTSEDPDRLYIGKTKQYTRRARRHQNDLLAERHGNSYLQRLFNKGRELNICPLEFCSEDNLTTKETFWVRFFKSNIGGYNLSEGGESIPDELLKWTDERKKIWSERATKKPISKGVKRSEVWKAKMKSSVAERKRKGLFNVHLNKKCVVTNLLTNEVTQYRSIKEAAAKNGLAYTYLIEKVKAGNGEGTVKKYKVQVYG